MSKNTDNLIKGVDAFIGDITSTVRKRSNSVSSFADHLDDSLSERSDSSSVYYNAREDNFSERSNSFSSYHDAQDNVLGKQSGGEMPANSFDGQGNEEIQANLFDGQGGQANSLSEQIAEVGLELAAGIIETNVVPNANEQDREALEANLQTMNDRGQPTPSRLEALKEIAEYANNVLWATAKLSAKVIETLVQCVQCVRECIELKFDKALDHLKKASGCAKDIKPLAKSFVAAIKNEREQAQTADAPALGV